VATSGTAATWQSLPTGTGTVTSVAMTVPSFLSVTGSPVTSTGTLAVSLSGTALPVANGGTGVTTSTGSGNTVLSTSPTLVTPILGTPTSGTLTSCTGLPVSTGVSGLGTNVATFLATPSSANLAAALTDKTGTGVNVFANAPTFPAQINLTANSGYNIYASGTADNYMAGSLGIGGVPVAGYKVLNYGSWTGVSTFYGFSSQGTIQSDVTATSYSYRSAPNTAAASFTLGSLIHYVSEGGVKGAGSTISNQYGFFADSSITNGVNNIGFYGGIAAGTGRYNLYMGGTADNYLAGSLGVGATPSVGRTLQITKTLTGTTTVYGFFNQSPIATDVTTTTLNYTGIILNAGTALGDLSAYTATIDFIGAGATISTLYGFNASSTLTGATNNYGFYGGIPSGTGRYNLYMAGTADNYLAGRLGIGTASPSYKLSVSDNIVGSTVWANVNNTDTTSGSAAGYFASNGAVNAVMYSSSNAGIGTYGMTTNHPMTLITNNTERMRIDTSGNVGIGTTSPDANSRLTIGGTPSVSSPNGQLVNATFSSAATGTAVSYSSLPNTAAAAFTMGTMIGFKAAQGTIGAASAVTSQYGFLAESNLTGATNNAGFFGNIAAAAGRYNFYAGGSAVNAFSGDVNIFGAGKLGYTTGSGGAVTQTTSRTTTVTLNKTNGAITLFSALGTTTYQSFTVNNSTVSATDVVILTMQFGFSGRYSIIATATAGGFWVDIAALGTLYTEAPVINFAVIKAVNA
jgi:hypothetical protein